MDGKPCGPIGSGYKGANTVCCDRGAGFVNCDGGRVVLTHTLCQYPSSCVQYSGWSHWKRDEGDEDRDEDGYETFAQCELH
jgi:hypothetical protein